AYGDLAPTSLEELAPGDVRAVPDPSARHALMHLEPGGCSVHVVSRSLGDKAYMHESPRLAFHATITDRAIMEAMARSAGLDAAWEEALTERAWQENAHAWRDELTSPEHRFFLAILLLAPHRAAVFDRVRGRYGANPAARVLRWMEELAVRG